MRILLFGGTIEGRTLAEAIAASNAKRGSLGNGGADVCHVCVATQYGASLLPEAEGIVIHDERMDEAQMEKLIKDVGFDICIDATHPYAEEVSANIRRACAKSSLKLYRVARDNVSPETDTYINVENVAKAVEYLAGTSGNIFITTGSKELKEFTHLEGYKERCFARVLPTSDVMEICSEIGFPPKNIIGMQGPFGYELNVAMLKACNAKYLVTKASGNEGGFIEKCRACRAAGAEFIVIGRPKEENEKVYGIAEMIELLGLDGYAQNNDKDDLKELRAYVIGVGCGNINLLTAGAIEALLDAECIIGARRLTEDIIKAAREDRDILGVPACRLTEGKKIIAEYDKAEIGRYLKANKPRRVALLYSGDIGFYSGAAGIDEILEGYETVRIPGISSGVYLCDILGIPWQDVRFISCHGREADIKEEVLRYGKLIVLLGKEDDVSRICSELCKLKMKDAHIIIGEDLSYENERITQGTASELTGVTNSSLAVMLIDTGCYEQQ